LERSASPRPARLAGTAGPGSPADLGWCFRGPEGWGPGGSSRGCTPWPAGRSTGRQPAAWKARRLASRCSNAALLVASYVATTRRRSSSVNPSTKANA